MEGKQRKRKREEKAEHRIQIPPNDISGTETNPPAKDTTSNSDQGTCRIVSQARSSFCVGGRLYTVSIALPGSIISNAQNLQMKTYLVGQIGRAVSIFNVDEIIVFDETEPCAKVRHDPNTFLCKLLQYLDTPQYLRKSLFPMQEDLKFAGVLNPIDAPHHMRVEDESTYREGIVIDIPTKKGARGSEGSFVYCGTEKKVLVDRVIKPGSRVTVKLDNSTRLVGKYMTGTIVPPSAPRTALGLYWGYTVRMADCLSDVFTNSPHKGGYDLVIGTSERGTNVDTLNTIPGFKHLLIVFGGLKGLEYSLEGDEKLMVENVSLLFDYYLNTCPKQGSRTIRTEEAILVTLSALRPLIEANKGKGSA